MAFVKISELPAASSVAGTEEIEVNQGGTSRKVTAQQIANLGGGGGGSAETLNPFLLMGG